jgi:hypothetical protein
VCGTTFGTELRKSAVGGRFTRRKRSTRTTSPHWFFGNLYEALVRIPDRVAASEASRELPRSPFGAGSPGRYYAPIAPITAPAAAAALMAGWNRSDSRAWLIVAAASSAAGAGATAYLLRSINPVLFFSPSR